MDLNKRDILLKLTLLKELREHGENKGGIVEAIDECFLFLSVKKGLNL